MVLQYCPNCGGTHDPVEPITGIFPRCTDAPLNRCVTCGGLGHHPENCDETTFAIAAFSRMYQQNPVGSTTFARHAVLEDALSSTSVSTSREVSEDTDAPDAIGHEVPEDVVAPLTFGNALRAARSMSMQAQSGTPASKKLNKDKRRRANKKKRAAEALRDSATDSPVPNASVPIQREGVAGPRPTIQYHERDEQPKDERRRRARDIMFMGERVRNPVTCTCIDPNSVPGLKRKPEDEHLYTAPRGETERAKKVRHAKLNEMADESERIMRNIAAARAACVVHGD